MAIFKKITCALSALLIMLSATSLCGCDVRENNPVPEPSAAIETPQAVVDDNDEEKIVENATLKTSIGQYDTLNPITSANLDVSKIFSLVCEPLFELDDMMDPVPLLAADFIGDVSYKVWEVTLKDGLKFHDGAALTADDVKATYDLAVKSTAKYRDNVDNIAVCYKKDAKTVQFILKKADKSFISKLTVPIVSKSSQSKDFPVGTGIFKVAKNSTKDKIVLEFNENYHNLKQKPHITKIEINKCADEYAKYTSDFDAGFIYGRSTAGIIFNGNMDSENVAGTRFVYAALNCSSTYAVENIVTDPQTGLVKEKKYVNFPNGLNDPILRKAVNMAISRETCANTAVAGKATTALLPGYSGITGRCRKVNDYTYDPDGAVMLLRSSGYTRGDDNYLCKDGVKISLSILADKGDVAMKSTAYLIRDALDKIGIYSELSFCDAHEFNNRIAMKQFSIAVMQLDLGNAAAMKDIFTSSARGNYSFYSNPKVDALFESLNMLSGAETVPVYDEIEQVLLEDNPIVGMFVADDTILSKKNVHVGKTIYDWYVTED